MNWQPIETAPKDGTPILVWDGQKMFSASWYDYMRPGHWGLHEGTIQGSEQVWQEPTHWMPLPEPPLLK